MNYAERIGRENARHIAIRAERIRDGVTLSADEGRALRKASGDADAMATAKIPHGVWETLFQAGLVAPGPDRVLVLTDAGRERLAKLGSAYLCSICRLVHGLEVIHACE